MLVRSDYVDARLVGGGPGDFVPLFSQNPDIAGQPHTGVIDLMLSVRTHGGQVGLSGLWASFVPSAYEQKHRTGLVRTATTTVVVSNGIETIAPALPQ